MAEANEAEADSLTAQADALALAEEAEAQAAEAEALAAAARARARAARLRRQALAAALEDPEDAHDDTENTESDHDRESAGRRLPLSIVTRVAAVLLIGAFAALSAFMLTHHRARTERQQRVAQFVAAAEQGIVNMTSMDFNRAKADVQRMLDTSTGQFRDEFASRAEDFTKTVEQSKVVTQGTINAAAVESMDEHSARVLVSATSRVTNSPAPKDEPRPLRFRVTVTEVGGQPKMSKVELVP